MEQLIKIIRNIDFEMLLIGILVLIVCLCVSRVLMRLFDRLLNATQRIDASLHSMLKTMLRIVLYFISIVFAANTMGIPVTSFLALFSVVGLAVSLAVQGVLSNLAGGMIILASKPFTLGDYIESDDISGTVNEIGFLHTRMISPDGKMIFVPNNLLYNSRLINYTAAGTRRIDITINMSYGCAPEDVRSAALSALSGISDILPEPAPQVLLENYAESSIQYTLRLWVRAQDYTRVRYAFNEKLYAALKCEGLEMSYPHINIHMQP